MLQVDFDVQGLLKSWGLDHRIHDRIAMLSGGQRRKVALLSGLIPAMISNSCCSFRRAGQWS